MSRRSARVLIIAGEASGDLYGSLVMRAMAGVLDPSGALIGRPGGGAAHPPGQPVRFTGVGGPAMRAAGLRPLGDAGTMGGTGFIEGLGSARAIWRAYPEARHIPSSPERAHLVLLIRYPGLNRCLAETDREAGRTLLSFR